jgi:hypothetical protein
LSVAHSTNTLYCTEGTKVSCYSDKHEKKARGAVLFFGNILGAEVGKGGEGKIAMKTRGGSAGTEKAVIQALLVQDPIRTIIRFNQERIR